jgi:hypothetical protein
MSSATTIIVGAILIGIIVVAAGAAYTHVNSTKLPEQGEMVQLFASGAIVGAFITWVISSGMLNGGELLKMISSDVHGTIKDLGIRGGNESAAVAAATTAPAAPAASVQQMVGGFMKSLGFETLSPQELSVGMPTF